MSVSSFSAQLALNLSSPDRILNHFPDHKMVIHLLTKLHQLLLQANGKVTLTELKSFATEEKVEYPELMKMFRLVSFIYVLYLHRAGSSQYPGSMWYGASPASLCQANNQLQLKMLNFVARRTMNSIPIFSARSICGYNIWHLITLASVHSLNISPKKSNGNDHYRSE